MKLDVDSYLARRFDMARMNCWHLVQDAWLDLTGRDLGDRTPERITTAALVGAFDTDVPTFERIAEPESPSIVLMRARGAIPHVGLFYRGRVLQMTVNGASYMPLAVATAGFAEVSFYR